ncbi:helix-turn-helix transcriptional regulator [Butyricicoccus pullicaecorum]|uniref:helix-turn-helix transcriptional regulator n=1 Tax=Butyricicoccus pullicaecorum TaxID=501571 RepID=UPI00352064E0
MPKTTSFSIEDLLSAISENLSAEEILSADVLSDLSAQITKERMRRKMTQSQFAELLEVSQGMVSKWESKDYNFTIETLCKIAVHLGWRFKASFFEENTVINPNYIVRSKQPQYSSPCSSGQFNNIINFNNYRLLKEN